MNEKDKKIEVVLQRILDRIEDRYLKNSHEYDRDVDFATFM